MDIGVWPGPITLLETARPQYAASLSPPYTKNSGPSILSRGVAGSAFSHFSGFTQGLNLGTGKIETPFTAVLWPVWWDAGLAGTSLQPAPLHDTEVGRFSNRVR